MQFSRLRILLMVPVLVALLTVSSSDIAVPIGAALRAPEPVNDGETVTISLPDFELTPVTTVIAVPDTGTVTSIR